MASTTMASADDAELRASQVNGSGHLAHDLESAAEVHLRNEVVKNIIWKGVKVTVNDRETKQPKVIVDNVAGFVSNGQSPFFFSIRFR
jgi:hypothetical protein